MLCAFWYFSCCRFICYLLLLLFWVELNCESCNYCDISPLKQTSGNWLTKDTEDVNNAIENKRIYHAFGIGEKKEKKKTSNSVMICCCRCNTFGEFVRRRKKKDLHCINIVIYYEIFCSILNHRATTDGFVLKPHNEVCVWETRNVSFTITLWIEIRRCWYCHSKLCEHTRT